MNDVYIDINCNLSLSMGLWLAALIWVILRIKATLSLFLPPSSLSLVLLAYLWLAFAV